MNMGEKVMFRIINQNLQEWDGSPTTLKQNDSVKLPQTPAGDIFVTFFNLAVQNDAGQISLTTGGSKPEFITVEPLMNAPQIMIKNFEGNNLNHTNISDTEVPIQVQAWGPGFGESDPLPDDGKWCDLPVYESRTTKSNPNYMRLSMRALGEYTVFGVFIGSTPTIYCVNAPDKDTIPVDDYTEVTSNNTKSLTDNWLGKTLYVVNFSALTSQQGEVALVNL